METSPVFTTSDGVAICCNIISGAEIALSNRADPKTSEQDLGVQCSFRCGPLELSVLLPDPRRCVGWDAIKSWTLGTSSIMYYEGAPVMKINEWGTVLISVNAASGRSSNISFPWNSFLYVIRWLDSRISRWPIGVAAAVKPRPKPIAPPASNVQESSPRPLTRTPVSGGSFSDLTPTAAPWSPTPRELGN
jgi:hypothetical protein